MALLMVAVGGSAGLEGTLALTIHDVAVADLPGEGFVADLHVRVQDLSRRESKHASSRTVTATLGGIACICDCNSSHLTCKAWSEVNHNRSNKHV